MLSYCLKCRKIKKVKTQKSQGQKNGRIMLLSKCAICESKKSKFIKQQEANGLLSGLGIKTSLSNIPWVDHRFL